jgi:CelD/BcsL family acetyltransferase involved in cellulose biosynthesis
MNPPRTTSPATASKRDAASAPASTPPRPGARRVRPCWVEEITTEAALTALANDWQGLSERAETALLFNSHEWASACWKHFHHTQAGRDRPRLWVLAVRNAAGLQGVAPFWVETRHIVGMPLRVVRFLGEGPADYGDLLLAAPQRPVLEAIVDHLAANSARWDLLDLREFFGESRHLPVFMDLLAARRWWLRPSEDSSCQNIPVENGWESYFHARFSGRRRKDLRREWRRLEQTGTLTKEVVTDVTGMPGIADAFAEVQAAHVAASEERPGEFNDPVFRSFLEEMLAVAAARRWLRIPILRRNDAPVAYWIAFLYRGRYFVYNTAHRADCQPYGAGKLLMLYMLEQFFTEKGGVIDYLRGAEPYKDVWTERTVINARLRVARGGLRAAVARRTWFDLLPWLQEHAPLAHRALTTLSEEGIRSCAVRAWNRVRRAV